MFAYIVCNFTLVPETFLLAGTKGTARCEIWQRRDLRHLRRDLRLPRDPARVRICQRRDLRHLRRDLRHIVSTERRGRAGRKRLEREQQNNLHQFLLYRGDFVL